MDKKHIQKQVKIFIRRVKKELPVEKVILFGSYARAEATEYSDIDIVVISNAFSKMREKARFDVLYKLSKNIYPDINAFGYTPEEMKNVNRYTSLYEAIHTGRVIS